MGQLSSTQAVLVSANYALEEFMSYQSDNNSSRKINITILLPMTSASFLLNFSHWGDIIRYLALLF
jgi:hypothetical protein